MPPRTSTLEDFLIFYAPEEHREAYRLGKELGQAFVQGDHRKAEAIRRRGDPIEELNRETRQLLREMEATSYPTDGAVLEQARRSKGHISEQAIGDEYTRLMMEKLHPWRSLWWRLTGRWGSF